MLLNCGFGEESWVPWTARRSNHSILKEISLWCSLEGLMLKVKLQYLGHLMWRADSEKTLILGTIEGRRRRGRQRMRCLDGIIDSMTSVWVNTSSWWWTGRPSVLQFMGSQRVRHDWATELNGLVVFPTFFNFCLNLAIRSSWFVFHSQLLALFCWLYRISPCLAVKNRINLISVLTI